MAHDEWRTAFHITPPTGWLNDPNGLCQRDGTYHVYHQWRPAWPDSPECVWGHATSRDLAHWEHRGCAIPVTLPEEEGGVWSGSAYLAEGAPMRVYYTANRKFRDRDDYDYVTTGRTACQVTATSEDGLSFSDKRVLLRNEDYPEEMSLHVRDPKVWDQDGSMHMLLGARTRGDVGVAMVWDSEDGLSWRHRLTVRPDEPVGYMWECPDRVALGGSEFLLCCPQGLPSLPDRWQNHDNSGYFPLDGRLLDCVGVRAADFVELDRGFDFYAPQTFVDESGRTLMLAWMSEPTPPHECVPDGFGLYHCLTVPRVLSLGDDGLIRQLPAPELDLLHEGRLEAEGGVLRASDHAADVRLEGVSGDLRVTLDGALRLEVAGGVARLSFLDGPDGVGAGRVERTCPVGDVRDLRLLVDRSAVELFLDGGSRAFATRWFPSARELAVEVAGEVADIEAWEMGNGIGW